MSKLHIDFETRSTVDLKVAGVDNYARHSTTMPWCMGWAVDDEEPNIWVERDRVCPPWVFSLISSGKLVFAHNASFELAIWNNIMVPRYGWPALNPEQVRCTMAMAYTMGLPGGLEKAAAAVGIDMQKDMVGNRLMLQMSKPRTIKDNTVTWWDADDKLDKLYEYCKQDVRVERQLEERLFMLSDSEQKLWALDYKINNRGIHVDIPAIKSAMAGIQVEKDRLNKEIREVTGNFVGFTTEVARIKQWLGTQGVHLPGLAKADVLDALALDDLPENCRKVLLLRQEASKTSTAKLDKMLTAASSNNRVKNTMQFNAAHTGRWGGRTIQPHNFPRPELTQEEIEEVLDMLPTLDPESAIETIEMMYGPFMHVISSCLRGMITAGPGNLLCAGDYSNIEGRGIAWLAGDEDKLEAFRRQDDGTGPEIYKLAASKIYHKRSDTITKSERQAGKVAELALGYQGGVGAFQTMATGYGITISDDDAEVIKVAWREAHPKIVQYWYDLERAAKEAVAHPGTAHTAGARNREVTFKTKASFLFCKLPSGRVLTYPYPKLKLKETPWGEMKETLHYMTVSSAYKWEETSTYGGKLAENITQAVCRDLLAHSIKLLDAAASDVVFHVHDEIVCELEKTEAEDSKDLIFKYMAETPPWAEGLPVVVEGWVGKRYRK